MSTLDELYYQTLKNALSGKRKNDDMSTDPVWQELPSELRCAAMTTACPSYGEGQAVRAIHAALHLMNWQHQAR